MAKLTTSARAKATRIMAAETGGEGDSAAPAPGFDGVESVERAFKVLDAFDEQKAGLALKDLAQRSGLTKSTILRLAVSLERYGYLVRDVENLYHLGPTLWRLGSLFRQNMDLGAVVRPVLQGLVESTKESASFYVSRNKAGVCLYRVNSSRLARDHVEEGDLIPLDNGATGHVLTAFTNAPGKMFEKIRRDKCYVSLGERDPDVAGIAVPVLNPEQVAIGAITLSGLVSRFKPTDVERLKELLHQAARKIEQRLGSR
jgi:DNA-binding IclR family transcriptional regulator